MQIFVVGNGRTGTNWMGQIIGSHPDVTYTSEQYLMPVTKAAVLPIGDERTSAARDIVEHYRSYEDGVFAHKVHPALWFIDELAEAFPDAKFIAMKRDPVAAVASMLRHRGVLRWNKAKEPTPFLGTTAENFDAFQKLEEFEKCAMRLKAHYDRIDKAWRDLSPDRVGVIQFEMLVKDAQLFADIAFEWFCLPPHKIPSRLEAKQDTLTKWKDTLTEDQAERIRELMQDG